MNRTFKNNSRRAVLLAAGATALLLAVGCSSGNPSNSPSPTAAGGDANTVTVYAAASLKPTFTNIGQHFEAQHTGTKVVFSFGGSSDLVTQLQQGAAADVLASADTKNMDKAVADNLIKPSPVDPSPVDPSPIKPSPVNFASNILEIATPPGNPAKIKTFADLGKPGVKVVVCAPQVPCGSATVRVEQATGVNINPVSEENSVTDVLNKVATGEADAGLVYQTDVKSAGDKVTGVSFPQAQEAVNIYPIAVLAASKNPELAQEFVDLVTGPEGQKVLAEAGFGKP